MSTTLYTATGCLRCRLVRQFLNKHNLSYREHDALKQGKDAFRLFYQANREKIYRGSDGIEFPVYCDNDLIRQGLPAVIGHLMARTSVNGFFTHGQRHGQWIDGVDLSGGDPAYGEKFLDVLTYLKSQGFKIQVDTNGMNADLLTAVITQGLADCIIMEVKGALDQYSWLCQQPVDPAQIQKSILAVSKFDQSRFVTTIAPIVRQAGNSPQVSYLTPEEVAEAAKLIETVTNDNRQPYWLRFLDPKDSDDEHVRLFEALAPTERFKYRSRARQHQFKTEIWQD
jgi:pyruvate formate lyase activating enzyme